jgi:hypothetical protein
MPENNFKKPYPTPLITFDPVGMCIYCNSVDGLTDEHIVPKALNGTMVLPKSSCTRCAAITSKFERTIAQKTYGIMRIKRDYKSRRKKERPQSMPISYSTSKGVIKSLDLDLANYPDFNLIPSLPLPGILTKAPLTEMNPEIGVSIIGDPNEIANAISLIEKESGDENIKLSLSNHFVWSDFYRLLAKIAHGYLVAYVGQEGYIPLLPDLVLGRSSYLAHYIGGLDEGAVHTMTYWLSLAILPSPDTGHIAEDEGYLAVYIQLLGGISMPMYQVICGKITNLSLIIENTNSKKNRQKIC